MTAPDPSTELMRLINGYQVSQALHVAATLGVADQLKDGDALLRNPITGIDCCASAGSGHAATVLPRSAMKLRRRMCPPRGRLARKLSVALCDRAASAN
jgi:hypothetical protein